MLTQKRLKDVLDYNKTTGKIIWRMVTSNRVKVGDEAGTLSDGGYKIINIDGKRYRAHRLVWLYTIGGWPENEIDHINGVRDDNRLVNLREVTRSENCRNQTLRVDNTSGVLGVYWHKPKCKWQAKINIGGRYKSLGYFTSIEDAAKARKEGEGIYGYHKNHGKLLG